MKFLRKIGNGLFTTIVYILFVVLSIVLTALLLVRIIFIVIDVIVVSIAMVCKYIARKLSKLPSWIATTIVRGWNMLFGDILPICEICKLPGLGDNKVQYFVCCNRDLHTFCHTGEAIQDMKEIFANQ